MKKIIERMRRLFAHGVWAANDTLVGIHPEGAINCVAGGAIVRNSLVLFQIIMYPSREHSVSKAVYD